MNNKIIGALVGDINGSIYEFDNTYDMNFEMFQPHMHMTDDSLLTLAIMKAWLKMPLEVEDTEQYRTEWHNNLKIEFSNMYFQGRKGAGFGGMFYKWCRLPIGEKRPYNSFGNGSAMRVSPVAYIAKDLKEAELLAEITASVTHNHVEGVKGAKATAVSIKMALDGKSKEEIRTYITKEFYHDMCSITYAKMREFFPFDETCQRTVPQAITVFLESEDYEDCVRKAVSLGGDCDTVAAIACSIASAYYDKIYTIEDISQYLREEDKETLIHFSERVEKLKK